VKFLVEALTKDLFEQVKEHIPRGSKISDIRFEGCEIVLYTKNPDFFVKPERVVIDLVGKFKKRFILRPDPSICNDQEESEKKITKLIPKEAGLKNMTFDPVFGSVTIEADKPGLVIGKGAETLTEIKKQTLWLPTVKRAPAIPSNIVKTLRGLIHHESAFRKKFLDDVGKSIHSGWKKTDWIRLTALGAFREVGRSAVLIHTPESRVLLDCGVKPGTNDVPYLNVPEADISKLNAVVLSHAHMDHAAMIPYIYEYGCTAPLYCTAPTRDLMVLLAMDYLKVVQKEGRNPPYSTKGIREAVKRTICLRYNEVSDITPDMRLTLFNSGHILGSALTHLHVGNGMHNILYTADIKFDRTALYEPASSAFSRAETIINESTYGLREDIQPRRDEAEKMLVDAVNKTIKRKGIILIPSFAVERAQDIQVILAMGGIKCPIYLDGMIWDATAIHTTYPEYMNRDIQKLILQEGKNPFTQKNFIRIGSHKEREQILKKGEPCVVVATSGMLIGGPSVWWLRKLAEDAKNTMVFVGYQAEGSMGRRIQKGWKEVPMEDNGKNVSVPINMDISTVNGLSGHSDFKQLMNYIRRLRQRPERIIVNHGEASKCINLARSIHKIFKVETMAPKNLETIRLK
jgi:uncharacterized protein